MVKRAINTTQGLHLSMSMPEASRSAVVHWARRNERIRAVYPFGSRAKGTSRPESDVDIAVILTDDENDTATGYAIFQGDRLRAELAPSLPMELHLHFIDPGDTVVWPAVQEHGVELYRAP
jgi:predicted nucleotidyltransferase